MKHVTYSTKENPPWRLSLPPSLSLLSALFPSMGLVWINTQLFSVQIPEMANCSVLMREHSRVEETIQAMQQAGAGSLQVSGMGEGAMGGAGLRFKHVI